MNIQLTKKEADIICYELVTRIGDITGTIELSELTGRQKYDCNTELELLKKLERL